MPDVCEDYHGREPFNEYDSDGPWITMGADQIRALADFVGDATGTFKVEYLGGSYWRATRLDAEGQPTVDERVIYALEARSRTRPDDDLPEAEGFSLPMRPFARQASAMWQHREPGARAVLAGAAAVATAVVLVKVGGDRLADTKDLADPTARAEEMGREGLPFWPCSRASSPRSARITRIGASDSTARDRSPSGSREPSTNSAARAAT